jgi:hypothetical protein
VGVVHRFVQALEAGLGVLWVVTAFSFHSLSSMADVLHRAHILLDLGARVRPITKPMLYLLPDMLIFLVEISVIGSAVIPLLCRGARSGMVWVRHGGEREGYAGRREQSEYQAFHCQLQFSAHAGHEPNFIMDTMSER